TNHLQGPLPADSQNALLLAATLAELDTAVGCSQPQFAAARADRARDILRPETAQYGDGEIRMDSAIRCSRTHLKFSRSRQRSVDAAVGGQKLNFAAPFGAAHGDGQAAIRRSRVSPFAGGHIHVAIGSCRFDDAIQVAAPNPAVG